MTSSCKYFQKIFIHLYIARLWWGTAWDLYAIGHTIYLFPWDMICTLHRILEWTNLNSSSSLPPHLTRPLFRAIQYLQPFIRWSRTLLSPVTQTYLLNYQTHLVTSQLRTYSNNCDHDASKVIQNDLTMATNEKMIIANSFTALHLIIINKSEVWPVAIV